MTNSLPAQPDTLEIEETDNDDLAALDLHGRHHRAQQRCDAHAFQPVHDGTGYADFGRAT